MSERLYGYINIDKNTSQKLFSRYDSSIEVTNLELIPEGLSTSNYIVHTKDNCKKYLLKIYPEGGGNSEVEVASYNYAKQYVNVPNIYLFNNSRNILNSPYVIMDYIEGVNLKQYVISNNKFPEKIAYDIGNKLALIHNRKYESRGLLNQNLDIKEELPSFVDVYDKCLNGLGATHISSKTRLELLEFIKENSELLEQLQSSFGYSHGDFSSSNILIDNNDEVWFIDFEYSLATSMYHDIGKFFRDSIMDKYRDKQVYDSFARGYNEATKDKLSDDWIKLGRLIDIPPMLALINRENPPKGWVEDIEESIVKSMKICRDEIL